MVKKKAAAGKACSMLKTLANEDRLMILCQLVEGEKNVSELEQLLGIRQPTLSQQLSVLREEELVSTKRVGKYIYYKLASREVVQIIGTLFALYCQDENALIVQQKNSSSAGLADTDSNQPDLEKQD
ncbi:hypothetical protein Nstercoris_00911 [Nitrosomonas stercoris]|uniref:HTH arsR-type domain-containing protein n=1 Tax=Nitrosomonas stercoris TaxID=1444684 RepID=A0A4Y1YKJ2_9PROT|nr:hypothetical protein Nstercoris_00911 [Nitrosomonas stercoris]